TLETNARVGYIQFTEEGQLTLEGLNALISVNVETDPDVFASVFGKGHLTIDNRGIIEHTQDGMAVFLDGDGNEFNNSGTVRAVGEGATGISASGSIYLSNSGSIVAEGAEGANSVALAFGSSATVVNESADEGAGTGPGEISGDYAIWLLEGGVGEITITNQSGATIK